MLKKKNKIKLLLVVVVVVLALLLMLFFFYLFFFAGSAARKSGSVDCHKNGCLTDWYFTGFALVSTAAQGYKDFVDGKA